MIQQMIAPILPPAARQSLSTGRAEWMMRHGELGAIKVLAELDGAGWFARFKAITVPQIKPETFVVTLTCTIAALKVFGPIYVLTKGGPENATKVPSYFSYQNFFPKSQVGYGASIATVLTLIVVVVALLFIRAQASSERKEGR